MHPYPYAHIYRQRRKHTHTHIRAYLTRSGCQNQSLWFEIKSTNENWRILLEISYAIFFFICVFSLFRSILPHFIIQMPGTLWKVNQMEIQNGQTFQKCDFRHQIWNWIKFRTREISNSKADRIITICLALDIFKWNHYYDDKSSFWETEPPFSCLSIIVSHQ